MCIRDSNATVQGVNWVVKNGTGSGEISNGYFIGRSAGTVTLEAHSADGITYNTMTVTVKLSGASIEEGLRAAIANKDEAYYISGDVTLSADIVIPDYLTLYIEDSGSLTIPNGVTLTNNSFIGIYSNITIQSGGKIINNGHLRSGGSIACLLYTSLQRVAGRKRQCRSIQQYVYHAGRQCDRETRI